MRATSSASMPAGLMSKGRPRSMSSVPNFHGRVGLDPYFIAQIAGVTGTGNLDGYAVDGWPLVTSKVFEILDVCIGDRSQESS